MFRYVEGITRPPAVAMVQGSCVHRGLEVNDKQKIDTHEDAPLDDVLDATATEFEQRKDTVEDWEGNDKGDVKDQTVALAKVGRLELCPTYQPIECEQEYRIKMCDTELLIIPDVVDINGVVRDRKVVGKSKTQADADNSLQLTCYAWGTGMKKVALDCLVKTKNPKAVTVESTRTDEHFNRFAHLVPRLLDGIKREIYLPADPTSWACSEKFCGYWNICDCGGKR